MSDNYTKFEKFFEQSTELLIRTVKVWFSYRSFKPFSLLNQLFQRNVENRHKDNWVLRNCSINVPKGKIYSLLGSSGCGKTTLLKCILGIEKVSSGSVKIFQNIDEKNKFKGELLTLNFTIKIN